MLLKPATPLSILLLIAFALLLLSCLSTPIVRGIPLATFRDVDYGVFGYCKGDTCTNIHVGYTSNDINNTGDDFNLPSGTRKSLSSILIVHPVAAFMTLVCLCLAIAAHFHGPSHSPRFLLALLILLLPTLLVTLLAFLVDILLFVPHLGWGGWIVLAATIILTSCGVVTCAMRRTLVSRKARKRRIAENAEMSGENYYNRQNAAAAAINAPAPAPAEPKEAFMSSSLTSDSGPTFATFHTERRDSDDDRTPLNSRTPMNDIPAPQDRRGTPYRSQQDEFGNVPPQGPGPYGAGAMSRNPSDPRIRPQYSDGSMGSRRGGAPPGFNGRGRGGYPPRGGRGGPYMGPSPGPRGGYMGPMPGRGGHSGMPPRGPPAGYSQGPGGPNRSLDGYGRSVSPPQDEYGYGPAPGQMRQPSPGPIGMAISPDTIGQAIEMTPQPRPQYDMHESNQPMSSVPHALTVNNPDVPEESPTSLYSRPGSYIPPRSESGWGDRTVSPRPGGPGLQANNTGAAYYEDVDPRFARHPSPANDAAIPSSLTPGAAHF
ncbi:Actin cortical patch SUR7/pH-response regulator PalI [Penicillium bovifimosum]|uniref:Actin cortical patch SUR7/pH-response regulator PalI n=1 Tax=Penicillium bovifimosum TaxID=126998 RepID=A0A9W9GMA3_9EURO|nr:Actin cortical patch SUR7/pH-response regulator PalI [Penicillium bovifimosum]KAJ5124138.1 Actin cortical patch SUR7/pH-response regulator PalI [Penicillium bovifimosum]